MLIRKKNQKLILLVILLCSLNFNKINAVNINDNNILNFDQNHKNLQINNESQLNENLFNFLNKKRKKFDNLNENDANKIELNNKQVNKSNNLPTNELKQQNFEKVKNWQCNDENNEIGRQFLNQANKFNKLPSLFENSNKNYVVNNVGANETNYDDDWLFYSVNHVKQMNYRIYEIIEIANRCCNKLNDDTFLPYNEKIDYDSDDCGDRLKNELDLNETSKTKYFKNFWLYNVIIQYLNEILDNDDEIKNCFIKKLKQFYEIKNQKLSNDDIELALECYKDVKLFSKRGYADNVCNYIDSVNVIDIGHLDRVLLNSNQTIDKYLREHSPEKCVRNFTQIRNFMKSILKLYLYGNKLQGKKLVEDVTLKDAVRALKFCNYYVYALIFKFKHAFKSYCEECDDVWQELYKEKGYSSANKIVSSKYYFYSNNYDSYNYELTYRMINHFFKDIESIINYYFQIISQFKDKFFIKAKLDELIEKPQEKNNSLNDLNEFKNLLNDFYYGNKNLIYMQFFGATKGECLPKTERKKLFVRLKTYLDAMKNLYQEDYEKNLMKLKLIDENFKIDLPSAKKIYWLYFGNKFGKNFEKILSLMNKNSKKIDDETIINSVRKIFDEQGNKIKNYIRQISKSVIEFGDLRNNEPETSDSLKNYWSKIKIFSIDEGVLMQKFIALYYFFNQMTNFILELKNKINRTDLDLAIIQISKKNIIFFYHYFLHYMKESGLLEINFDLFTNNCEQKNTCRAGFMHFINWFGL